MSFDLYFAGSQAKECDDFMIETGCNRLFSQLDDKRGVARWCQDIKGKSNKLFIDSGAFSALTRGIQIDIDEYISKIDAIGEDIYQFANLDVIPSVRDFNHLSDTFDAGWNNFMYIQAHSKYAYKCCFVFHKGEPESKLDIVISYYKQHPELKFFALGGLVGDTDNTLMYCIRICDKIKSELPYIKIHLFGYTRLNHLPYIRCDSTDSTTWLKTGATGSIKTRYGLISVSEKQLGNPYNFYNLPIPAQENILKEIKDMGFSFEQVSTDYKYRMMYNIKYFKHWSDTYKYKRLGIIKNNLI